MSLEQFQDILESWLIRIELFGDTVERISEVDPLTGHVLGVYNTYTIYPAYGSYVSNEKRTNFKGL